MEVKAVLVAVAQVVRVQIMVLRALQTLAVAEAVVLTPLQAKVQMAAQALPSLKFLILT
jgi:hypothetical protein